MKCAMYPPDDQLVERTRCLSTGMWPITSLMMATEHFSSSLTYQRFGSLRGNCISRSEVFSCGAILEEESREVKMYYGAADTCICVGTAKLDALIERCFEQEE